MSSFSLTYIFTCFNRILYFHLRLRNRCCSCKVFLSHIVPTYLPWYLLTYLFKYFSLSVCEFFARMNKFVWPTNTLCITTGDHCFKRFTSVVMNDSRHEVYLVKPCAVKYDRRALIKLTKRPPFRNFVPFFENLLVLPKNIIFL